MEKDGSSKNGVEKRQEEQQKEALESALEIAKKALKEETAKNEIISAISSLYKEIAAIDLNTMTYKLVSGPDNRYVRNGQSGTVAHLKDLLLNKNVFGDYREEVAEFINFDTLPERLKEKNLLQKN